MEFKIFRKNSNVYFTIGLITNINFKSQLSDFILFIFEIYEILNGLKAHVYLIKIELRF